MDQDRLRALLGRLNSRRVVLLTALSLLEYDRVRLYVRRMVIAGACSVAFLLNFGLDLDGRPRRRALAPGLSRLLTLLCVARAYLAKRHRLVLMGLSVQAVPLVSFWTVSSLHNIFSRAWPAASSLPASAGTSRFDDDELCAICLEGGCEYVLPECQHPFHQACLEQWVSTATASCPCCKVAIPIQEAYIDDYLLFSEGQWRQEHAVLGGNFLNRPLLE